MVFDCTRRAGDSRMLGRSESLGDESGQARESVTTTTNQAVERTATQRVFIFQMIRTVSVAQSSLWGAVAQLFLVRS